MSELISLQGKIYSALRNTTTGKPGDFTWLGNVAEATIALETEKEDRNESFSGNRLLYGSVQKSKGARFTAKLDEFLPENIALGLYGAATDVNTAVITNEACPSGLVAGDQVRLAHPFASSLSVHDSAGSPATAVLDSDYKIISASAGIIEIIDPSGFTQPFKVNYTYHDATRIVLFETAVPPERWILFDGINTLNGDKVLIDLYRVQFDPLKTLPLINEGFGGIELEGVVLLDEINLLDATFGGFGRMQLNKSFS